MLFHECGLKINYLFLALSVILELLAITYVSLKTFKGVLHLLPKFSMFCALSENNQQLFEK